MFEKSIFSTLKNSIRTILSVYKSDCRNYSLEQKKNYLLKYDLISSLQTTSHSGINPFEQTWIYFFFSTSEQPCIRTNTIIQITFERLEKWWEKMAAICLNVVSCYYWLYSMLYLSSSFYLQRTQFWLYSTKIFAIKMGKHTGEYAK